MRRVTRIQKESRSGQGYLSHENCESPPTVSGAILMIGVLVVGGLVAGVLTFGLAWIVWGPLVWVASMVWGSMAAADQSKAPASALH